MLSAQDISSGQLEAYQHQLKTALSVIRRDLLKWQHIESEYRQVDKVLALNDESHEKVTVSLGGDYFAEMNRPEARQFLARRLELIKEQKATIQKQIQELEMRLNLLTDDGIKNRVLPEKNEDGLNFVEIREELTESPQNTVVQSSTKPGKKVTFEQEFLSEQDKQNIMKLLNDAEQEELDAEIEEETEESGMIKDCANGNNDDDDDADDDESNQEIRNNADQNGSEEDYSYSDEDTDEDDEAPSHVMGIPRSILEKHMQLAAQFKEQQVQQQQQQQKQKQPLKSAMKQTSMSFPSESSEEPSESKPKNRRIIMGDIVEHDVNDQVRADYAERNFEFNEISEAYEWHRNRFQSKVSQKEQTKIITSEFKKLGIREDLQKAALPAASDEELDDAPPESEAPVSLFRARRFQ